MLRVKPILKWSLPLSLALVLAACGGGASDKNNDAMLTASELPASSPSASASPSASPGDSGMAPSAQVLPGFVLFKDEGSGVEIQYPEKWELSHDVPGAIVSFMTALEDGDKFRDNVSISMQDLGEDQMDLAQYVELTKQQLQEVITDFKMISEENFSTDDGLDIKVIKYTGKQGDFSLTWQQLLSIKNGKAYILTYLAEDDAFDKYVETVGKMVETLVIY
ncbi:PsbP-related protein [Cohnella hashimotonis]|uniref:PsbP-related protein n=1 Tax=Cohnella hashimotonis TaxID=2826895 RepID=A0ABT6TM37_9BACL|nr:PsbP-related protein [Cohnella hashimotonis]MDI4647333.1 PsbP-related protein [Cohnella hashimotonis]